MFVPHIPDELWAASWNYQEFPNHMIVISFMDII